MRRNGNLYPVRGEQKYGLSPWSGSSLLAPTSFLGASPWQAMRQMQDEMDRVFGQFFQPVSQELQRTQQQWVPSVDISQDEREWLIEAELPGVNKDQIHVELRNDQLLLRAEMRQEHESQPQGGQQNGNGNTDAETQGQTPQRQYYHRERRYGYFERVLPLPENVDREQIQCEFKDGILKLHLPKMAEQKPQSFRIPIGDGPTQQLEGGDQALEAQRSERQNGRSRSSKGGGDAKNEEKTGELVGGGRS